MTERVRLRSVTKCMHESFLSDVHAMFQIGFPPEGRVA
jgi:hypothetical protein